MTQTELVREILRKCPELTHRQAVRFVQAWIEVIRENLLRGEDVKIAGLGTWKTRIREATTKYVPRKGWTDLPAAPMVQWHPSDRMREELEQADKALFGGDGVSRTVTPRRNVNK